MLPKLEALPSCRIAWTALKWKTMSKDWAGVDIDPMPASIPTARMRHAATTAAGTRRSGRRGPEPPRDGPAGSGQRPDQTRRAMTRMPAASAVTPAITPQPQGTQAHPASAARISDVPMTAQLSGSAALAAAQPRTPPSRARSSPGETRSAAASRTPATTWIIRHRQWSGGARPPTCPPR